MRGMKLIMASLAFLPGFALAADCTGITGQGPQPLRPTVLLPVAAELSAPSYQLGAQSGVLAHAYDESQSVDQVLLRLRIEGCRSVAMSTPAPTPAATAIAPPAATAIDPNDPSVYKPKTEFDNTPWRFNMQQDGKQMTADEFDAWMKARGVRVVKARPVQAPVASADVPLAPGTLPTTPAMGSPPGASPQTPATVATPSLQPVPAGSDATPASLPAPAPATGDPAATSEGSEAASADDEEDGAPKQLSLIHISEPTRRS